MYGVVKKAGGDAAIHVGQCERKHHILRRAEIGRQMPRLKNETKVAPSNDVRRHSPRVGSVLVQPAAFAPRVGVTWFSGSAEIEREALGVGAGGVEDGEEIEQGGFAGAAVAENAVRGIGADIDVEGQFEAVGVDLFLIVAFDQAAAEAAGRRRGRRGRIWLRLHDAY